MASGPHVAIIRPDGSERENLGSFEFTGPGTLMAMVGWLYLHAQ